MKVKDLIESLKERDQEGTVYVEVDDEMVDVEEVTYGKQLNPINGIEDFTILNLDWK